MLIDELKRHGHEHGFSPLIIPLQETARGDTPERAALSMADDVELKGPDGLVEDHWFQTHFKLGAEPLAVCEQSHGYAMGIEEVAVVWEVPDGSGIHVL